MLHLALTILACGIGNIHGQYPANWQGLNFDRLKELADAMPDMPLVLHGGSGIPQEQVVKAISMGVSKLTSTQNAKSHLLKATRKYIEEGKDKEGKGYDPRKLLLHLVHKLSQIQLKKSSIGSVHQKLNNLKIKKTLGIFLGSFLDVIMFTLVLQ